MVWIWVVALGGGGCAHGLADDLAEVQLEQVSVVLAVLVQGGVVGLDATAGAVVGDADEQSRRTHQAPGSASEHCHRPV